MKPIIAIVGRPNVGKSTLFNRILRRREAVVAEESGVTRDRHYSDCEWAGIVFTLIDTGGIVENPDNPIEREIRRQAEIAVQEADRVIFMVDVKSGINPDDSALAEVLRRDESKVVIAANKADNQSDELAAVEFHSLGLGQPHPVSALQGRGVGDLLDIALEGIPQTDAAEEDDSIKIAVVGRPNVGKSSLVNAITNQERLIVDSEPGTTRDSIDTKIRFQGSAITLIDTAGLRRPSRVKEVIEFFSNLRTARALDRCDVALVMFEAPEYLTAQDIRVLNEAVNRGKGTALLANKWDSLEKETGTFEVFQQEIYRRIPGHTYIPMVTMSALTKQRIHRALMLALETMTWAQTRIPTSELNKSLLPIIEAVPPPAVEGKYIKIKYVSQITIQPTAFSLHCNFPHLVAPQYRRFLERKIRERYGFPGIPLKLKFLRK